MPELRALLESAMLLTRDVIKYQINIPFSKAAQLQNAATAGTPRLTGAVGEGNVTEIQGCAPSVTPPGAGSASTSIFRFKLHFVNSPSFIATYRARWNSVHVFTPLSNCSSTLQRRILF